MVYADLEKKRAYHRAYYHRKLGGKGGAYQPRELKSDEELLAFAKEVFQTRHDCSCGAVIPSNRLAQHLAGKSHAVGVRRREREEKLRQEEEKRRSRLESCNSHLIVECQ